MRRTPTVRMWLGRCPRCQRRLQTDTLWRVSVIECLEPRPLATNLRRHFFAYNATPIGTQRLSRTRSAPGRDGMLRTGKLLTLCRRFEGPRPRVVSPKSSILSLLSGEQPTFSGKPVSVANTSPYTTNLLLHLRPSFENDECKRHRRIVSERHVQGQFVPLWHEPASPS